MAIQCQIDNCLDEAKEKLATGHLLCSNCVARLMHGHTLVCQGIEVLGHLELYLRPVVHPISQEEWEEIEARVFSPENRSRIRRMKRGLGGWRKGVQ